MVRRPHGLSLNKQGVAEVDQAPGSQILDASSTRDGDGAVGFVKGFGGLAGIEIGVTRQKQELDLLLVVAGERRAQERTSGSRHVASMSRPHAALLLAILVVLAGARGSSAAEPPFEIDAILSRSGTYAFQGEEGLTALSIIESQTNRTGGINGRPIRFVISDDQSSPAQAVQAADAIIAKHATVLLGPAAVSLCGAIAPLLVNGPVMYCFSPRDPSQSRDVRVLGRDLDARYVGRREEVLPEPRLDEGRVHHLDRCHRPRRRPEHRHGIRRGERGARGDVAHEHFNASDLSLGAQMAKIKGSGAQVLVAWTTGTPFGTVLRNAAEAGLGIPVLTTAGNLSDAEMHAFAAFLPKELYFPATPAFAPDQVPPGPLKRSLESYFAALKAAGAKPENATSLAWDGTLLVIEALRKLGTTATAAQIREYLAGLRGGIGIYGPHDFVAVPQRGLGIGSVVMVRWDGAKGWVAASGLGVSALRRMKG